MLSGLGLILILSGGFVLVYLSLHISRDQLVLPVSHIVKVTSDLLTHDRFSHFFVAALGVVIYKRSVNTVHTDRIAHTLQCCRLHSWLSGRQC